MNLRKHFWVIVYLKQALQLIEDRAIHFHLTQSQVFMSSRDDYVNIAAIHPHPVTRVTVELLNGTSWDAWDHSTPGRRSRDYLVNPRRLPGHFTLDSSLGSVELQNLTTPKVILGKLSQIRFLLSMSGITEIFVHTHFLFGFWYFLLTRLILFTSFIWTPTLTWIWFTFMICILSTHCCTINLLSSVLEHANVPIVPVCN